MNYKGFDSINKLSGLDGVAELIEAGFRFLAFSLIALRNRNQRIFFCPSLPFSLPLFSDIYPVVIVVSDQKSFIRLVYVNS